MRAKEISVVTASKLGNSSGYWLRIEHTPVTEPETAKHESSEPIRVGTHESKLYTVPVSDGRVPL